MNLPFSAALVRRESHAWMPRPQHRERPSCLPTDYACGDITQSRGEGEGAGKCVIWPMPGRQMADASDADHVQYDSYSRPMGVLWIVCCLAER